MRLEPVPISRSGSEFAWVRERQRSCGLGAMEVSQLLPSRQSNNHGSVITLLFSRDLLFEPGVMTDPFQAP